MVGLFFLAAAGILVYLQPFLFLAQHFPFHWAYILDGSADHRALSHEGSTGAVRIFDNNRACEVLWCLGWAIIHRSVIGICLVPLWWLGLLFHIFIEEESLERELGQNYLEYKKRIRGRIIPGLPI